MERNFISAQSQHNYNELISLCRLEVGSNNRGVGQHSSRSVSPPSPDEPEFASVWLPETLVLPISNDDTANTTRDQPLTFGYADIPLLIQ